MFSRGMFVILALACAICGCSRGADRRQARREHGPKQPPSASRALRRVYPHSVIPGGVESSEAFDRYRKSDQILREHFGDLGSQVIATKLSADRWMYASYRFGDRIFWTHNRVLVHRGESLLTDGKSLVRGRCGNRLSESPEQPVLSAQPPSVTTDRFTVEVADVTPPELTPAVEGPEIPGFPDVAPPDSLEAAVMPGPPQPTGMEEWVPEALPPATETNTPDYVLPTVPATPTKPPAAMRRTLPPLGTPMIPTPELHTWATMLAGLTVLGGCEWNRTRERSRVGAEASSTR